VKQDQYDLLMPPQVKHNTGSKLTKQFYIKKINALWFPLPLHTNKTYNQPQPFFLTD